MGRAFIWALFAASVFVEPDTVFDPDFLHSEMTVTTSKLHLCIPDDDEDEKASDTWNDITAADMQKTPKNEQCYDTPVQTYFSHVWNKRIKAFSTVFGVYVGTLWGFLSTPNLIRDHQSRSHCKGC